MSEVSLRANQKGMEPEGVLLLDKPENMTSHDCVNRIRRLYGTRKVGHTGTLDPMATGLLPILIGRTAKAAEYLVAEEKHYLATLRLGLTTDTEDIWGTALTEDKSIPDEDTVRGVIASFIGESEQIPPMYSALKVDGQKLYELARQGTVVERKPRPITVYALCVTRLSDTDYALDIRCSKGTYIRTLCADIGARLGCGGVMASLRRLGTGSFSLSDAHTIEALEEMAPEERFALLRPTETLFDTLPRLVLPAFYERLAKNGQEIYLSRLPASGLPEPHPVEGTQLRVCGADGIFFGLGEVGTFPTEKDPAALAVKVIKRFVL